MIKIKSFFDIEKEEKWLNTQLQNGFRCTNISSIGTYTFEKTDKNYVIRLDYQDYFSKEKLANYQTMYEDFGWGLLKSSRSGLQYWQKEDDAQNELYSDRQSESSYYKRVMTYTLSLTFILLFFSSMLYKDTGLYLTQGLWSMEGSLFWKALLFETPFVLLRLLPAILTIFFATSSYTFYKQYILYKD